MIEFRNKWQNICVWPIVSLVVNIMIHYLFINSNILQAWDIKNVEIINVSEMIVFGTQSHTRFSYDLAYGCMHAIDLSL